MTTSLPTTSPVEILPGVPAAGSPGAMADELASLLAPAATDAASAPAAGLVPAFDSMLAGRSTAAPSSPVVASSENPAPASVQALSLPATPATAMPIDARELHCASVESATVPRAVPETAEPALELPPSARLPDRTTLEAAAALLLPALMVEALPAPIAVPTAESPAVPESTCFAEGEALRSSAAAPSAVSLPLELTVKVPGHAPVRLTAAVATTGTEPAPVVTPASGDTADEFGGMMSTAASHAENASAPRATPANPGVPAMRETSVTPAAPAAASAPRDDARAVPANPGRNSLPAEGAAVVTATVELADGSTVALEVPAKPAIEPRVEKNAALAVEKNPSDFRSRATLGKNFLSTDDKELKPAVEKAGIAVAETRPTMFALPHDPLPAVQPTVPALVTMVSSAAVSAEPPAAAPDLTAASLAHRAVATVTNVVEAQAASKLQPVPSVQLKFKFGSEDLAVRVELRDGVVRTEFRTDSSELRTALAHEWKMVAAAQPESALRFLEPVVSPASPGHAGSNAFAQQQQQQQQGQSASQQQQHSRAAAELFGSIGRSAPASSRSSGETGSNPVAPVVLPTSVHLSAVA